MCLGAGSLCVAGCGSGGATGVNAGNGTQPASQTPAITTTSSVATIAGRAEDLTITVTGSNFVSTSLVEWNNAPLTTTYTSPTSLTAGIPSADFATAGTATITVVNPSPAGQSNGVVFTIGPATNTPGITEIDIVANDLAWDPVNQVIYLSLPSTDGSTGNSIQILDPKTGKLGASVYAGSEPDLLSVSANSKYLYVGLDGEGNVGRMILPSLSMDFKIPLGRTEYSNTPYLVLGLQAAPNADGTVAVMKGSKGDGDAEGGISIFDESTPRPNQLCTEDEQGCVYGDNYYGFIQWNQDGSKMFASDADLDGTFYTIPVTSSGFGTRTAYPGLITVAQVYQILPYGIHYDATTGYVYDDDGETIDPASGQFVREFPVDLSTLSSSDQKGHSPCGSIICNELLMVPDGKTGVAYFLGGMQVDISTATWALEALDIRTTTPLAILETPNVVGRPSHLIRWGTDGLAFTTSGAVYLVRGPFVSNPEE